MRLLILLFAMALSSPLKADDVVAMVSVCSNTDIPCTKEKSKSFYSIPIETKLAAACFMPAMMELAKMSSIDWDKDIVFVVCEKK